MYHFSVYYLIVFLLIPFSVSAYKINMQVIIYPPLAYEEDGMLQGVAPDIVREIQKMVGDTNPIVVTPWLRAYERSQTEPDQALFAIVRIPEREKLFKWVGPIFGEGDYFFRRKGSALKVESLDDARRMARIGVRKDGYTHQALLGKGFANLDVGPTYASSYQKLINDRVDLVLMGEHTYVYMVSQAGLDPTQFERTDCKFGDSAAWLAFSRDTPDQTIQKWQDALDQLKASGRYDAILNRYFHPKARH